MYEQTEEAMTDTAIGISQADIELLEQLYTWRGRTEILQFVDQYPFLVPVLLEAPQKIRQYFPDSGLFLEYTRSRNYRLRAVGTIYSDQLRSE